MLKLHFLNIISSWIGELAEDQDLPVASPALHTMSSCREYQILHADSEAIHRRAFHTTRISPILMLLQAFHRLCKTIKPLEAMRTGS